MRKILVVTFSLLALTHICQAEAAIDPYDVLSETIGIQPPHESSISPLIRRHTYRLRLFNGNGYIKLNKALDAFSALSQEKIESYTDVKRAFLQSHLWAVFDWTTELRTRLNEPESLREIANGRKLQSKLASLIKRLALSEAQILALPNTMMATIESGNFSQEHDVNAPRKPFFPSDLYDVEGPWVSLQKRNYTLLAENHAAEKSFRSAFLISDEFKLILSPLYMTVQIRTYTKLSAYFEKKTSPRSCYVCHPASRTDTRELCHEGNWSRELSSRLYRMPLWNRYSFSK